MDSMCSNKKKRLQPEYLTVRQAAELLGVDRHAVYDMITRGDIPAYRLSERSNIYMLSAEFVLHDFC